MEDKIFHHQVHVYYDDTDFSGVVYHANYLKYFEHAREHAIGPDELVRMWEEEGLGFVIYKVEMQFAEGAVFGDVLDIRSHVVPEGPFRLNWHHEVWRPGGQKAAVKGIVQLVCVNKDRRLVPIPEAANEVVKKDT